MEKYIKPTCETIDIDMENSLLAASGLNDETGETGGDGQPVWHSNKRRSYGYYDEEEDF